MADTFVLQTKHSLYLFVRVGATHQFVMTSSNPKYAGPTTVRFSEPPVVGTRPMLFRVDGPRAGLYLQLSRVTAILPAYGDEQ